MANLDQILKEIEDRQAKENETITHSFIAKNQTYEVRTFTKSEKKNFSYEFCDLRNNPKSEKFVKFIKPYIYKTFSEMPQLAVRAKEAELIKVNYDIVEEVFDIFQMYKIMEFFAKINEIVNDELLEEIEEIKKQSMEM